MELIAIARDLRQDVITNKTIDMHLEKFMEAMVMHVSSNIATMTMVNRFK